MKISATFYNDAGELMAPRPLDVKLRSAAPGGIPSIEAGFYYRFKFEGSTMAEFRAKYERFFARMRSVPGYMSLSLREYDVKMGNFVRHGLDVIYVIESAEEAAAALAAANAPARGSAQATRAPSAHTSTAVAINR